MGEVTRLMIKSHFILYVDDQDRAMTFYSRLLDLQPSLHVPGMTEFELSPTSVLGLMPEEGIRRLLGPVLPDPGALPRSPRAEIYLVVDDADLLHSRALEAGARELSAPATRDWGHRVGYSLDLDGHVLALASVVG